MCLFSCKTKQTGLEPATSAVTGLRSNQTELPLRRFYRIHRFAAGTCALYRCRGGIASLFLDKCGRKDEKLIKIEKISNFVLTRGVCSCILRAPQHYAVPEKEKAPVAQLDRASDYGSEGLRFESSRACFQQGISENSGSVHSKPVFLFTVFLLESKKAWGRPGFD